MYACCLPLPLCFWAQIKRSHNFNAIWPFSRLAQPSTIQPVYAGLRCPWGSALHPEFEFVLLVLSFAQIQVFQVALKILTMVFIAQRSIG